MKLLLIAMLLTGCATTGPCRSSIDWAPIDHAIRAASWKTSHCAAELTGAECDTLWLMHESAMVAERIELDAIVARNRADFERGAR